MDHFILITGASRGIGLELAKQFLNRTDYLLQHGIQNLVLVARKFPDPVKSELDRITKKTKISIPVHYREVDLSKSEEATELMHSLSAPAIQIHNAGLLTGGLLHEQSEHQIKQMFQVNLQTPMIMARHWLPELIQRKSGIIVFNTSVSSQMFFPCASTYAASKAGLYAFAESLREEIKGHGLKVTTMVTPGVKTQMYDEIESLYGKHLDLSFMTSMPADRWASRVVDAIERGEDYALPEGAERAGLWLARHWPKGFKKWVIQRYFKA